MSDYGLSESKLNELRKKNPDLVIFDLRKKEEFAKGHIKGSRLVEFDERELIKSSGKTMVLVSKSEEQSKKLADILRSKNIESFFLIGGIKGWTRGLYCKNIEYVGTDYP